MRGTARFGRWVLLGAVLGMLACGPPMPGVHVNASSMTATIDGQAWSANYGVWSTILPAAPDVFELYVRGDWAEGVDSSSIELAFFAPATFPTGDYAVVPESGQVVSGDGRAKLDGGLTLVGLDARSGTLTLTNWSPKLATGTFELMGQDANGQARAITDGKFSVSSQ